MHADSIIHCGDYGQCYIKNDLTEVFIVLGDADSPDLDEFEEFVKLKGLKFTVSDESAPVNVKDYTIFSYGIYAENYEESGEELQAGEIIPMPLLTDDYILFKNLFNGLDN